MGRDVPQTGLRHYFALFHFLVAFLLFLNPCIFYATFPNSAYDANVGLIQLLFYFLVAISGPVVQVPVYPHPKEAEGVLLVRVVFQSSVCLSPCPLIPRPPDE